MLSLFGRGEAAKSKSLIKGINSRLDHLKNKRKGKAEILRRDIGELLRNGKHKDAFFRVELLVTEENLLAVYDMVEKYCETINKQFSSLQKNRNCTDEVKEAIASLIFAAARCAEIPELQGLRGLFATRFGDEFAVASVQVHSGSGVSEKIVEYLGGKSPSTEDKLNLMKEIAHTSGLNWSNSHLEDVSNFILASQNGKRLTKTNSMPHKREDKPRWQRRASEYDLRALEIAEIEQANAAERNDVSASTSATYINFNQKARQPAAKLEEEIKDGQNSTSTSTEMAVPQDDSNNNAMKSQLSARELQLINNRKKFKMRKASVNGRISLTGDSGRPPEHPNLSNAGQENKDAYLQRGQRGAAHSRHISEPVGVGQFDMPIKKNSISEELDHEEDFESSKVSCPKNSVEVKPERRSSAYGGARHSSLMHIEETFEGELSPERILSSDGKKQISEIVQVRTIVESSEVSDDQAEFAGSATGRMNRRPSHQALKNLQHNGEGERSDSNNNSRVVLHRATASYSSLNDLPSRAPYANGHHDRRMKNSSSKYSQHRRSKTRQSQVFDDDFDEDEYIPNLSDSEEDGSLSDELIALAQGRSPRESSSGRRGHKKGRDKQLRAANRASRYDNYQPPIRSKVEFEFDISGSEEENSTTNWKRRTVKEFDEYPDYSSKSGRGKSRRPSEPAASLYQPRHRRDSSLKLPPRPTVPSIQKPSCLSPRQNEAKVPHQRTVSLPANASINNSLQQSKIVKSSSDVALSKHVHPKLPDYDDLAARFTALKKQTKDYSGSEGEEDDDYESDY